MQRSRIVLHIENHKMKTESWVSAQSRRRRGWKLKAKTVNPW